MNNCTYRFKPSFKILINIDIHHVLLNLSPSLHRPYTVHNMDMSDRNTCNISHFLLYISSPRIIIFSCCISPMLCYLLLVPFIFLVSIFPSMYLINAPSMAISETAATFIAVNIPIKTSPMT